MYLKGVLGGENRKEKGKAVFRELRLDFYKLMKHMSTQDSGRPKEIPKMEEILKATSVKKIPTNNQTEQTLIQQ